MLHNIYIITYTCKTSNWYSDVSENRVTIAILMGQMMRNHKMEWTHYWLTWKISSWLLLRCNCEGRMNKCRPRYEEKVRKFCLPKKHRKNLYTIRCHQLISSGKFMKIPHFVRCLFYFQASLGFTSHCSCGQEFDPRLRGGYIRHHKQLGDGDYGGESQIQHDRTWMYNG